MTSLNYLILSPYLIACAEFLLCGRMEGSEFARVVLLPCGRMEGSEFACVVLNAVNGFNHRVKSPN